MGSNAKCIIEGLFALAGVTVNGDKPYDITIHDRRFYRRVTGKYDRVVSIGIMEHVGYKNYLTYMETVDRTLKDDGIAFVHTIGQNVSEATINSWTGRYIFPNSMLPSIAQLGKAMEGLFIMEDWHNFGPDYDKTLMAWHANFEENWPELKKSTAPATLSITASAADT